jgi:hypothetical protein
MSREVITQYFENSTMATLLRLPQQRVTALKFADQSVHLLRWGDKTWSRESGYLMDFANAEAFRKFVSLLPVVAAPAALPAAVTAASPAAAPPAASPRAVTSPEPALRGHAASGGAAAADPPPLAQRPAPACAHAAAAEASNAAAAPLERERG